jgi:predicted MFS family arabinose efflux permease
MPNKEKDIQTAEPTAITPETTPLPHRENVLAYVLKSSYFLPFVIIVTISNIAYNSLDTALPLYAKDILQSESLEYSIFEIVLSLGTILGAYLLSKLHIKSIGKPYALAMIASALIVLILALTSRVFLVTVLLFMLTLCDALTLPSFTRFQTDVPKDIRGRVYTLFDTIVLFASIPTAILVSWLCGTFGISSMIYITALLYLIVATMCRAMPSIWKASVNRENA